MVRRRVHVAWLLALVLPLAACQGSGPKYRDTGVATPTVSGAPTPSYPGYDAARLAFTRTSPDGSLTATLEDAAWIRFEGDPEGALKRHKAYFEGVATVFNVIYRPSEYVRVPQQVFILEDSAGHRMTAKPKRYEGEMELVDDHFHFTFDLKYAHTITRDLKWIRLTDEATGQRVEWTLSPPAPAAATAQPATGG